MYENIFCLSVMFMATLVAMVIVIDSDAGGDSDGNNDGDSNGYRDSLCVSTAVKPENTSTDTSCD